MSNSRKTLENIIKETEERLASIQSLYEDLLEKQKQSNTDLQSIVNSEEQAKTILENLRELSWDFNNLKDIIDNEETGINANLISTKDIHDEALVKVESMRKYFFEIEQLETRAKELKNAIENYEELTTGYKQKIEDTYNFMNGQGLAHSFYERKKEIQGTINIWRIVIVVSILLLLGVNLFISYFPPDVFSEIMIAKDDWYRLVSYIVLRAFFSSPIIFSLWYAIIQHNKERIDLSVYAFKWGVAKALENYTDLLTDKFKDDEGTTDVRDDILKFTIMCMKNIYEDPNNLKAKLSEEHNAEALALKQKQQLEEFKNNIIKPVADLVKEIKSIVER